MKMDPSNESPILENVHAVAELERRLIHDRTTVQRLTDVVTSATGTIHFVIFHIALFAIWAAYNLISPRPFDPYPFSLLNLLVSLEAIVLTSFVLVTQNRMTQAADRRAHIDLQINLLAEQELTAMLHMLHALCREAGVSVGVQDLRVAALLKETDIRKLASALDDALKNDQTTTDTG